MNTYPGLNSVIVIDNYSTHKSLALHKVIEAASMSKII